MGLVWTVYEMACFLTLFALSEVVDLPVIMLRQVLAAFAEVHGGASDSVHRRLGAPVLGQGWLMVQTVPKTVWRFVVVQKTIEISQLQFIDKVLPYVVAQKQIPMVLRQCRKLWFSAVAIHHGSAAVLGQDCLHARCAQTFGVCSSGQGGHACCCGDRCMRCSSWTR